MRKGLVKTYTGSHLITQLHVGVIVAHREEVVLARLETKRIVPYTLDG